MDTDSPSILRQNSGTWQPSSLATLLPVQTDVGRIIDSRFLFFTADLNPSSNKREFLIFSPPDNFVRIWWFSIQQHLSVDHICGHIYCVISTVYGLDLTQVTFISTVEDLSAPPLAAIVILLASTPSKFHPLNKNDYKSFDPTVNLKSREDLHRIELLVFGFFEWMKLGWRGR